MEQASQVAASMNLDAVKEPRGFIRLIEFILAIFAFATTTSHSTISTLLVTCDDAALSVEYKFGYHYNFGAKSTSYLCPTDNTTQTVQPWGNFSGGSQFYVFVGVMAFLYSLASVVLYVWFDDKYRNNPNIPVIDFAVTGLFSLFWLIGSAVWASDVSNVKLYSSPSEWASRGHVGTCDGCEFGDNKTANFASLNVSLIFGFLNMVVWGANLWFLLKETKWFPGQGPAMTQQPPHMQPPHMQPPHMQQQQQPPSMQQQQQPPYMQPPMGHDQPPRPPGQPGYI